MRGETKAIDKLMPPETQAVGVMAAFRDLEPARWRGVALLMPGKDNAVTIHLEGVFIKTTHSALWVPGQRQDVGRFAYGPRVESIIPTASDTR